jgi:NAD(P)-dependent dehydrogenase (short-subunit alcohol dehydrogenase family)
MMEFDGKAAIVTGASRGIGRAIATRLARDGMRAVLCGRDASALTDAVQQIEKAGGAAASIALDLRLPESPPKLVEFAMEKYGRIDVVVNNAGATKRADFFQLTDEDWADGFALKFFGAVRVTRAAWPHLKATRGSVINISGIGGRTPGAEFAIGGSVNAAMLTFTKAMAEVGIRDGVQVNAINPGNIRTERFQKRLENFAREKGMDLAAAEKQIVADSRVTRIGEPEDIAALVAFLASREGSLFQGSLIDMDAGATKTV